MVNRAKAIGTAAETAVVRYARTQGFPHADRLALRGSADAGDVRLTAGLTAGVVLEVKGGAQARAASPAMVARWREQTDAEAVNAGAAVGLLVLARTGYGTARAGQWWVLWPWPMLAPTDYLRDLHLEDTTAAALAGVEARTTLADALLLLRARGYGDPLPTGALTTDHDEDRQA